MSNEAFEELQTQVARTLCPQCRQKRLELLLRCDLGLERCLAVIRCANCDASFELASGAEGIARERIHVQELLVSLRCAGCNEEKLGLGFQCDLGTRECAYQIVCRACGESLSLGDRRSP